MPRQSQPLIESLAILAGVALMTLLVGSSFLFFKSASSNSFAKQAAAIEAILQQDAQQFTEIRAKQQIWDPTKFEDVKTVAALGKSYHQKVSALDLGQCPDEFRHAYENHIATWLKVAQSLRDAAATPVESLDARKTLGHAVRKITEALEHSWAEVSVAAERFGIYIRE